MTASPVVIEVTRGPVVESRHEGIAAIVKPDGTVVASWGDIDQPILPRSANKPIQAMAFVESGAVERFGLRDSSRKAVKNKTLAGVGLFDAVFDNGDDDVVRTKRAAGHDVRHLTAERSSGLDRRAQHVAGRELN